MTSSLITRFGGFCVCLLGFFASLPLHGEAPVITSFSANGSLICSNLAPGSTAVVEWSASLDGPWRTNWSGLDAVSVGTNGIMQVAVPMFYRVRGTAPVTFTNHAPVAVDDNVEAAMDTPVVRAASVFLANDVDPDAQPLTIISVQNAANGFVSLLNGTVTFTPNSGFTGTAGFDYTISDGELTDTGHVTVLVAGN